MHEVVGVEIKTMQLWERGVTKDPPLSKALLFAEEVGVPLQELAETALGRPYREPPTTDEGSDPLDPAPARANTVERISARDKKKGAKAQQPQQSPHRRGG